jgi:hypothetical protein
MVAVCPCPACLQDQPSADVADNDLLLLQLQLQVQQLLLVLSGLSVAIWRIVRFQRRFGEQLVRLPHWGSVAANSTSWTSCSRGISSPANLSELHATDDFMSSECNHQQAPARCNRALRCIGGYEQQLVHNCGKYVTNIRPASTNLHMAAYRCVRARH